MVKPSVLLGGRDDRFDLKADRCLVDHLGEVYARGNQRVECRPVRQCDRDDLGILGAVGDEFVIRMDVWVRRRYLPGQRYDEQGGEQDCSGKASEPAGTGHVGHAPS